MIYKYCVSFDSGCHRHEQKTQNVPQVTDDGKHTDIFRFTVQFSLTFVFSLMNIPVTATNPIMYVKHGIQITQLTCIHILRNKTKENSLIFVFIATRLIRRLRNVATRS